MKDSYQMSKQVKVLVCGGRYFGRAGTNEDPNDPLVKARVSRQKKLAAVTLNTLKTQLKHLCIIQGGALGADNLGKQWAQLYEVPNKEYPADWNTFGKAAGIMRNETMLNEGAPDIVVAFPGGIGTAHMVKISKKAGVKVIEVEDV